MKSLRRMVVGFLINACLFTPAIAVEEAASLQVADAVICKDVVDRVPVDADTVFSVSVGKLCCFTRITGAQIPTTVTHVWYFEETERGRMALPVGSPNWRTMSSKIIQAHEIGRWHVDVLAPNGRVLFTIECETTR